MKQKKFILQESELPTQWYNIQADMVNKPLPPLNPGTHEPLKPEDLFPYSTKNAHVRNLTRNMPG